MRMWNRWVVLAALLPGMAQAALYRCGSNYQDRPCEDATKQEVLRPSGVRVDDRPGPAAKPVAAPAKTTAAPSAIAACHGKAERAERIAWKREGGASRAQMLDEMRGRNGTTEGREQEALINQVYGRKGSAGEIRAAVHNECLQQARSGPAPSKLDAPICAALNDQRKRLEIQSRAASTEQRINELKQIRAELDERILMGGCQVGS